MPSASLLHVHIFTPLLVHPCNHTHTSLHRQVHTHTHTQTSIKEWPTHMPLHVGSQWGFCSACVQYPPCLCHVFHIEVVVWWAPAGGGVGALSLGCACGPNPLINSAGPGRRWQVGTETECTPPVFLPLSDPEIPLTSIRSLLLMDCCWSVWTALLRVCGCTCFLFLLVHQGC